jgi:hypothetical protein
MFNQNKTDSSLIFQKDKMKTTLTVLIACAISLVGCANPRISNDPSGRAYITPRGQVHVITVGLVKIGNQVRNVKITKVDGESVFGNDISVTPGSHIFTICDMTPNALMSGNPNGRMRPMTINAYVHKGQVWRVDDIGVDIQIMSLVSDWRNP